MPGKVLIADDSLKIQRQLTEMLQGAGVEVVSVSNGEHAVRKLPDVRPDVVLADIFMPVRSGYEVCEYIKNHSEFAYVPVLLLASTLEPYDEKEADRVRADGRLEKPFAKPEDTLATIQGFLKQAVEQRPAESAPPEPAVAEPTPVVPEPEPEPELEEEIPARTPLKFEPTETPMSFTEMLEEAPAAEEEQEEAAPAAETPLVPEPLAPEPVAEVPPAKPDEETIIAPTDLAEPWEMTGPQAGAPEIPTGADWDSQWKDGGGSAVGEEAGGSSAAEETAPAAEEPAAEGAATVEEHGAAAEEPAVTAEGSAEKSTWEVEETAPGEEASAEEPAPVAEEPVSAEESSAEEAAPAEAAPAAEFGGTFDQAIAKSAREAVAEVAETQHIVNPKLVEEVVKQVLERLSPQVTEAIAREIVRPLAENLLKEKLKE